MQIRLNDTLEKLGWELQTPPLIKSRSGRFCPSHSHFPEENGGAEVKAVSVPTVRCSGLT